MENLVDLDPSDPSTMATLIGYLQDLVNIGVKGFRLDAAKHMWPSDIQTMFDSIPKVFLYQEVVDDGTNDVVTYQEYQNLGNLLEFKYGDFISTAFRTGQLAG